jgi:hypothetical protein
LWQGKQLQEMNKNGKIASQQPNNQNNCPNIIFKIKKTCQKGKHASFMAKKRHDLKKVCSNTGQHAKT